MRTLFVIILVACASPLTADEPKDARADLTGNWFLDQQEDKGKLVALGDVTVLFVLDMKKGKYEEHFSAGLAGGYNHKGTLKVVSGEKNLFKIDLDYSRSATTGEKNSEATKHVEKGTWELVDKDTLRFCSTEGDDRPEKFEVKAGKGNRHCVLKRAKEK